MPSKCYQEMYLLEESGTEIIDMISLEHQLEDEKNDSQNSLLRFISQSISILLQNQQHIENFIYYPLSRG